MILSIITLSALLGLMNVQTGSAQTLFPSPAKDICPQFQFDGETRLDCSRTTCLAPLNSTRNCLQYCEVRRRGFIGDTMIPQAPWNELTNAWEAKDIPEGELVNITTGINQTSWMENAPGMEAILDSVGYESPTLQVRTMEIAREDVGMSESQKELLRQQGYKVRWVYFPLLIETCGTMREQKYNATASGEGKCYGDLRETENRCVTGAWTNSGEAVVGWAQRYEHANGSLEGIDQPNSYQTLRRGIFRPTGISSDAADLRAGSVLASALGALVMLAI